MIKKLFVTGTFTFPYGEAASSRMLNLACGFSDHLQYVKVISIFGTADSRPKRENIVANQGREIPYEFYAQYHPHGTSLTPRLKNRFTQLSGQRYVLKRLAEESSGSEEELIFVYGRSFHFLKALIELKARQKWKSKIVFDIVEPPTGVNGIWNVLKHPFILDSINAFKPSILSKFDFITFISSSLAEKYSKSDQPYHLLPSILYLPSVSKILVSQKSSGEATKIGYLGSLITKDHPDLILKFMSQLEKLKVNFKLEIIGRFDLFAEGRDWKQRFIQANFGDNINFYFNPDNDKRDNLLRGLDFLIMFRYPDELQRDTFPTRVVELLGMGKPLLIYPFGDIELYFKNTENCYMVSEDNLPNLETWKSWNSTELKTKVVEGGMELLRGPFNASVQARILLSKLNKKV